MTVIEVREEKSTFSVSFFFFSPSRLIERRDLFSLRLRRHPLFNSRLSSPASATQMLTATESFTQQNTPDSIRMLMWKFTCLHPDRQRTAEGRVGGMWGSSRRSLRGILQSSICNEKLRRGHRALDLASDVSGGRHAYSIYAPHLPPSGLFTSLCERRGRET